MSTHTLSIQIIAPDGTMLSLITLPPNHELIQIGRTAIGVPGVGAEVTKWDALLDRRYSPYRLVILNSDAKLRHDGMFLPVNRYIDWPLTNVLEIDGYELILRSPDIVASTMGHRGQVSVPPTILSQINGNGQQAPVTHHAHNALQQDTEEITKIQIDSGYVSVDLQKITTTVVPESPAEWRLTLGNYSEREIKVQLYLSAENQKDQEWLNDACRGQVTNPVFSLTPVLTKNNSSNKENEYTVPISITPPESPICEPGEHKFHLSLQLQLISNPSSEDGTETSETVPQLGPKLPLSLQITSPEETKQTLLQIDLARADYTQSILTGQPANWSFTVTNHSRRVAHCDLSLHPEKTKDSAWMKRPCYVQFIPNKLDLHDGQQATVWLQITPPSSEECEAGAHPFYIEVANNDNDQRCRQRICMYVQNYDDFEVRLAPVIGSWDRRPVALWRNLKLRGPIKEENHLQIHNKSNRENYFRLEGRDLDRLCIVEAVDAQGKSTEISQIPIKIPAGQIMTKTIKITPARQTIGRVLGGVIGSLITLIIAFYTGADIVSQLTNVWWVTVFYGLWMILGLVVGLILGTYFGTLFGKSHTYDLFFTATSLQSGIQKPYPQLRLVHPLIPYWALPIVMLVIFLLAAFALKPRIVDVAVDQPAIVGVDTPVTIRSLFPGAGNIINEQVKLDTDIGLIPKTTGQARFMEVGSKTLVVTATNWINNIPILGQDGLGWGQDVYDISKSETSQIITVIPAVNITHTTNSEMFSENIGIVIYKITLSDSISEPITVNYRINSIGENSASETEDYEPAKGSVILSGRTSITLPITIVNDDLPESLESFRVDLTSVMPEKKIGLGASKFVTATIRDDDTPNGTNSNTAADSAPIITIANTSASETQSVITFTITLDKPSIRPLTYLTQDDSAKGAEDYVSIPERTLQIPTAQLSITIPVTILADELNEGAETFFLLVRGGAAPASGTGTILADDGTTTASIEAPSVVGEDDGSIAVSVRLSPPSATPLMLQYRVEGETATVGEDFSVEGTEITVPANQPLATISVNIKEDMEIENVETFKVILEGNDDIALGQSEAIIQIVDSNEALPTPEVSITDPEPRNEGVESMDFIVSLSSASPDDVRVQYETIDGSAVAGSDYAKSQYSLIIPAGQNSAYIRIGLLDDEAQENDESFSVRLTEPENATLGNAEASGTIVDNDGVPTLQVNDARASERDGIINFRVELSAATIEDVTIDYKTVDGSAVGGADFVEVTDGQVTIFAGETSVTIEIDVNDNAVRDFDKEFQLEITGATNARIEDAQATGMVADDEGPPRLSLVDNAPSNAAYAIASEHDNQIEFKVELSAPIATDIQVQYRIENDTTAPGDVMDGIFTIAEDQTTMTFGVDLSDGLDDQIYGLGKQFRLQLISATDGVEIQTSEGTGIIEDNDELQFSIEGGGQVEEGEDAVMIFTVTPSRGRSPEVTIELEYTIKTGEGVTTGDYMEPQDKKLVFTPSNDSLNINIPILIDNLVNEGSESITVTLVEPNGNRISWGLPKESSGTIIDTTAATVSITPVSADVDEGKTATFDVKVSSPTEEPITVARPIAVEYRNSLESGNKSIQIAENSTSATIELEISPDHIGCENPQEFTVSLTRIIDGNQYLTFAQNNANGTIFDASAPPSTVNPAQFPLTKLSENNGVTLRWDYKENRDLICGYRVYRRLTKTGTIPPPPEHISGNALENDRNATQFFDNTCNSGNTYEYLVYTVYKVRDVVIEAASSSTVQEICP